MKLYISADMEGTAGITHWDETNAGHPQYEYFRDQMTREVAAACEGAMSAGAEDILIKDAHDSARNIKPSGLPEKARIFRGWDDTPCSMMAGIDESFDGVVFTGYHSAAGTNTNPLAHTMNTGIQYVKINGGLMSELMINALTASYFKVPVYCVTGDKGLCDWVRSFNPNIAVVPVSEGYGSGSISIHPDLAVKMIRRTVEDALKQSKEDCMFPMPPYYSMEICYKDHRRAAHAANYPGCMRTDSACVAFETDDYMDVLKMLYWVL